MASTYIKNGRVILGCRIRGGLVIAISGDKIVSVGRNIVPKKNAFVIDAKGSFVSPGFIDCHIHGEPEKIFFNEARHGMTAFVIAESCAPLGDIYKKSESIKKFIKNHPFGQNVLGLRLEGPYISKNKAGAQNISYIRKPNAKELSSIIARCAPILKIMTMAPELKNIHPLIRLLRKHRISPSIGHSDASYEAAVSGIDAGINHSTHTFNAMSGIDRREPGAASAVLMDNRVTAEIILDFIHVHRALFELLLRSKERGKIILVTDSIVAQPFEGAREIGGAYRFGDGRLAGSSLNMIGLLKNAVKCAGLSLEDAIGTITLNPAKFLGVEKDKGSLGPGKDADIVIFDKEFDVKMTMIRGRIAFIKGKICAG